METAEAMLETKRLLYVGFMCHQAIEKILKGYYFRVNQKTPPYTHNLSILSKEAGIYAEFSEEYKDFIDSLSPLNVKARYPAYKKKIINMLDKKKCKEILIRTREFHLWIKKRLLKK